MKDRIALVTGANKGIGFEICRRLAQEGIKTILTARNEQKGKEAAGKLQKEGLDIVFLRLDVTDEESVRQAAKYIRLNFGRLDILINNAGIRIDNDRSGLDVDMDDIKETMETNAYGPLRVCKAFVPIMQENNYGRIINVASSMGSLHRMGGSGEFNAPGYRISKAALNAVTRILASELEGTNILVNSVSPGHTRTDMTSHNAALSVQEGADNVVWLITSNNLSAGEFFYSKKIREW